MTTEQQFQLHANNLFDLANSVTDIALRVKLNKEIVQFVEDLSTLNINLFIGDNNNFANGAIDYKCHLHAYSLDELK